MSKQRGTFSYPGSKTVISPWIVQYIPEHHLYVEPFGGAASVLVRKERSPVEVYNDINGLCVDFFRAVKDHGDELAKWVENTPYSRELFDEWVADFREGDLPDHVVERAGRFLYVQASSFGGRLADSATWAVSKSGTPGGFTRESQWRRKPEDIRWLRDRFRQVQIEHSDYREVLDRYDDSDAFMYFDPPYIGVSGQYYDAPDDFDHEEFVDILGDLDCRWMVSYDTLPDGLDSYYIQTRSRRWKMNVDVSKDETAAEGTEKLVMNYDLDAVPLFSEEEQSTLSEAVE